jgi:hypothetical protein
VVAHRHNPDPQIVMPAILQTVTPGFVPARVSGTPLQRMARPRAAITKAPQSIHDGSFCLLARVTAARLHRIGLRLAP